MPEAQDVPTEFYPEDWGIAEFTRIVDFTRKPGSLDVRKFDEVPFISMDAIPDSGVTSPGYEMRRPKDIKSGSYCEKGDILLAKITPCFENGKQAIADNIPLDFAYATTEVFAFKPKQGIAESLFLFYHFQQPYVRKTISEQMEGTTGRQRVPKSVIEKHSVPLPPLPEQRRIAAVLNAIQDAIAAQEDVIAAARQFKRSLMQRLFTYGPGREPAETKETEIGEIPAHWEVRRLGDIVSFTRKRREFNIGDYRHVPFIPMEMVPDEGVNITKFEDRTPSAIASGTYCEPGDILLAKITPSFENGKQGIVTDDLPIPFAYATTEVFPLKSIDGVSDRLFVFYLLKQESVRTDLAAKMEGTTGRQRVPKSVVAGYLLPIAPIHEQEKIASYLAVLDEKIAAEEDRKTALEALFKSMLHQLMTGQIRLFVDEGILHLQPTNEHE